MVYWTGDVPARCQLSGRPIRSLFVDGRVPGTGSWALMTPGYFRGIGGTYGTGCGQLYQLQEDGRWLKIEG